MDTSDKPKVRVVKAGERRLRSGLIRVESEDGVLYRGACDRCTAMVTCRTAPEQGRELLCKNCVYVARVGKPSTKVKRKGDKALFYLTECDLCGDEGKTPFLPKKERPYLCDLCYAEADKEKAKAAPAPVRPAPIAAEQAPAERAEPGDAPAVEFDQEHAAAEAAPAKTAPAKVQTPAPPAEPAYQPTYKHSCRRCRKKFLLKFRSEKGERFICPDCFEKESQQEEKRKDRPSTRLIFKIECVVCGKHESVDFVPKSLTESICTECFNKRRRK